MPTDPASVVEAEPKVVADAAGETDADLLIEDELLVEDVSIDGMCGVY